MYPPALRTRKRNICACEPTPVGHARGAATDMEGLMQRRLSWTRIVVGLCGALNKNWGSLVPIENWLRKYVSRRVAATLFCPYRVAATRLATLRAATASVSIVETANSIAFTQ